MTRTTYSPDESSLTTTSSDSPQVVEWNRSERTESGKVLFAVSRFDPVETVFHPAGAVSIDDFVANLESDAEWSVDLQEARKEVARELSSVSPLAALRLAKGLSQRDLAAKVGASQPQIAKLEKGKGNPEVNTLRRVAGVLDVGIDQVLLAYEAKRNQ